MGGLLRMGAIKPKGYWQNPENFEAEAREIVDKFGHLPSKTGLGKNGYSSFCHAAHKYYGGLIKVRERLGLKRLHFSKGHWKSFKTVRERLEGVVGKLGHFPTQRELTGLGECALVGAITKYHEGLVSVAEKLGYETNQRKRGYWKDWDNIERDLDKLTTELGHFPSYQEIGDNNNPLLRGIEHHHGGYNKVRGKKGLSPRKRKNNFWADEEKLIGEVKAS